MYKITAAVEGMKCPRCEEHVNEAVKKRLKVRKVTSSHTDGSTVIISEADLAEQDVKEAISSAGYTVASVKKEPYVKKGLFWR